MKVVSDASAIIALSAIGRLEIIRQLYQSLLIPQAVHQEVIAVEATRPGVRELFGAGWIITRRITNVTLATAMKDSLGDGEAEAIVLALEIGADILLMDERRGRRMARRHGQQVLGVLGTLVEAKHHGLIPELKPVLHALATVAGFHFSHDLYQAVLRAVGEDG